MNTLNNTINSSFNFPTKIERIVFSDFDETYMPYSDKDKQNSGIYELERFIEDNSEKLSFIFGWVTGSSLEAVMRKSKSHINKMPHFIASSLGSEFYWVKNGVIEECEEWEELIRQSGFVKEHIDKLVRDLQSKGLDLPKQIEDYQGKNMGSYYYYISNKSENDLLQIEEMASKLNIKVLFTKCNPAAGDPENCFDVQFMPKCCGKKEACQFLINFLGVNKENTWAFGDSFNDYEILMDVGNPYLVANADPAIKEKIPEIVLNSDYCYGIKDVLKNIQL